MNIEEALNHPQTIERKMVISKDDYKGVSSPIKFSRSKSVGVKHKPPFIGQHTREILNDAGYDNLVIDQMIANQIIFENKS